MGVREQGESRNGERRNVGKWSGGNRNEIEGETVDVDCRKAESAGPWIKLGMMLSGQKEIKI